MTKTEQLMAVTFVVYANELDPQQVSDRLGVVPTEAWRKGDQIRTKRAQYGSYPIGGWLLSSRDNIEGGDLSAHLDWVLTRLERADEEIAALRRDGFDVALKIAIEGSPGGGGPTLSEETLARIARLRVPVDFDVYS